MKIFSKIVFFGFLALIFLFEGLGIKYGHEVSYFLILILPFFLYFIDFFWQKKILIPKKIIFLFTLFLFLVGLSTIFAVNVQKAFEGFLYYISVFLIFIYAYNHKDELLSNVSNLIIILGLVFSTFSFFLYFFPPAKIDFLIPQRGSQYVYKWTAGIGHSSLGSFLLIVLLVSLLKFLQTKKSRYALLFIIFLPQFLLSFDKSAYFTFLTIGMAIALCQFFKKQFGRLGKFAFLIMFFALVATVLFIFFTLNFNKKEFVVKPIQQFMTKNLGLVTRDFSSSRREIFSFAILAIKEKPLFGFGTNNFGLTTYRFRTRSFLNADPAHNIFLDFFAENGIPAGMIFILITGHFLNKAIKNLKEGSGKDENVKIFSLLVIAFLILFQIDFTYRIYSFFLLFFILLALIYDEKEKINLHRGIFIASGAVFILANCMLLSKILVKNQSFKASFYLYPLNREALAGIINNKVVEYRNSHRAADINNYLLWYERLYSEDPVALYYSGRIYQDTGQNEKALERFRKAHQLNPLNIVYLEKERDLQTQLKQYDDRDELTDEYLNRLQDVSRQSFIPPPIRQKAIIMCGEIYFHCPYKFR